MEKEDCHELHEFTQKNKLFLASALISENLWQKFFRTESTEDAGYIPDTEITGYIFSALKQVN